MVAIRELISPHVLNLLVDLSTDTKSEAANVLTMFRRQKSRLVRKAKHYLMCRFVNEIDNNDGA